MRVLSSLVICTVFFLITSCFKEENPVPKPQPGNMETVTIDIGFPYLYQVYYDCKTNTIVQSNTKYDWDIAFECSDTGYHVLLNNALGMLCIDKGNIPITDNPDISNASWKWDNPNGDLDSTAIGDWRTVNSLFILNRQYDDNGNHLGYVKIKLTSVDAEKYIFSFSFLNTSTVYTDTVYKNASRNFIFFSFSNAGKVLNLEPPKNNWDLLFSNHHHKFDNLDLPFVLTQVLTNKHNGVTAAEDNDNNFLNIQLSDTAHYIFTDYWDEIGYDWKIRNNLDNSYTIDPNKSFIVRATNGIFYKIRFIDFYNSTGSKGYPKFEIQRL